MKNNQCKNCPELKIVEKVLCCKEVELLPITFITTCPLSINTTDDNKIPTQTYLVPFEEKEKVWTQYNAIVDAESEEEAFYIINLLVKNQDGLHNKVDAIYTGISTHIDNGGFSEFNNDNYSIDDVKIQIKSPIQGEGYKTAEKLSSSAKTILEFNKADINPNVVDILEGISSNIINTDGDKKSWLYNTATLKETLSVDFIDEDFVDDYEQVWHDFVSYLISQNAKYLMIVGV